MSTACRSCEAPIRWERTAAGKRMPLDAEPVPDGTVAVVDGLAVVLRNARDDLFSAASQEPRYMPHWATCPNADAHRNPRGR